VGTGWVGKDALLSRGPDHYFEDLGDTDSVLAAIAGSD